MGVYLNSLLMMTGFAGQDLYEEAMDEGITFDQFHKWLERRLEGTPELSFVEEDRKAMAAQPQRRSSLPMRAF